MKELKQLEDKELYRITRDYIHKSISLIERAGVRCPEIQRSKWFKEISKEKFQAIYYEDILTFLDKLLGFLNSRYEIHTTINPFPLIRKDDD